MVSVIHRLFLRYPKTQQLLDTECVGSGDYSPEIEDPENCNALASTSWEFSLLTNHFHPVIKNFSRLVSKMDNIEGNHSPIQLLEFYAPNIDKKNTKNISFCNPPMIEPKPHALDKRIQKIDKKKKKNGVVIAYFVRPSTEYPPSQFENFLTSFSQNLSIPQEDLTQSLTKYYKESQLLKELE